MHPAIGRDFEKAGLSDSIFSCQFVSWLLVSICFYYGFLGVSMFEDFEMWKNLLLENLTAAQLASKVGLKTRP